MGSGESKPAQIEMPRKKAKKQTTLLPYEHPPADGSSPISQLSPELLDEILARVGTATLLRSAARVCRRWEAALQAPGFWLALLGSDAPPHHLIASLTPSLPRLAHKRPIGRNLIRNPSGEEGMNNAGSAGPTHWRRWRERPKHWYCPANGGDGWALEKPPSGSDAEASLSFPSAFVTSYGECEKVQAIDLVKEGLPPDLIDSLRPPIRVEEWHAGRWDCGSSYWIKVELLGHPAAEGLDNSGAGLEESLLRSSSAFILKDSFEDTKLTQNGDNDWTQSVHVFKNYPEGVRFVRFSSGGNDTQFWAGHYGPKTAKASVRVFYE